MSRLTDAIDAAGEDEELPPALAAPLRAVTATTAPLADALFQALLDGLPMDDVLAEGPLAGGSRLIAADEDAYTSAGGRGITGSYRGHALHTLDAAAGRMALHALRLLDEEPLDALPESSRELAVAHACAVAEDAERRGVPFSDRLHDDAVDAYFVARGELRTLDAPAAPDERDERDAGVHGELTAALAVDGLGKGLVVVHDGDAFVMARAGRPALLVATRGGAERSARAFVELVVSVCDRGASLTLARAHLERAPACLAMWLDERACFDALAEPLERLFVRGFERA